MCWLPPRVTWQPTLPRCVLRDRPTISPVASLGVRSSTKNERHRFPKPRYIACYSWQGVFDTFLPPLHHSRAERDPQSCPPKSLRQDPLALSSSSRNLLASSCSLSARSRSRRCPCRSCSSSARSCSLSSLLVRRTRSRRLLRCHTCL